MRKVESVFLAVLAYSYLRFSHPEQAKGDSYRRQTELRDAWLKRNKVTLDTSLTLEDKGVSGFFGDHRRNPDRHALAAFLDLVKKGRITKGSFLIVENLDRLSREDIIPALSLLLELIQAGIRVVQLLPVETIFDAQANPMLLMMAIMELSRGHSESAVKSERLKSAWQEKKRRAAEDKKPLTAKTPTWLRLVDGEWEIDHQAVETVRRIYRMAIDGYGVGVIVRKLNADKVPVIGGGDHWANSSVARILGNRAVVGEYQPYKGRVGKRDENGEPHRKPDGKPIAGYYPAIITEDEWYAARAALASRRNKVGRLPSGEINVFNGLLHDARDGGSYHLTDKGKQGGGKILVPYNAVRGIKGAKMVSFPAKTFEDAILLCLKEIDPRKILPDGEGEDKTLVLGGQLAEVEAEIEKLKNRLGKRYSDAVAEVLERQEDEQKRLLAEWKEAQQKAASPLSEAWGQCKTLLEALATAPDQMEARLRLRSALRRIVESIYCLFVPRGAKRLGAVQIWFAGGKHHRDYLILHRPEKANAACRIPGRRWCDSLASIATADKLDLRRREDAEALAEVLGEMDLNEFATEERRF